MSKIVILRKRYLYFCCFNQKAAQDAGAVALIIVNNVEGTIGMSGADATITIPVVSMTR
jgi:hypothetical protein